MINRFMETLQVKLNNHWQKEISLFNPIRHGVFGTFSMGEGEGGMGIMLPNKFAVYAQVIIKFGTVIELHVF